MINVEERHWQMLLSILKKYPYAFYAFGSRVKGQEQRYSDLDICYMEPIPLQVLVHLQEELEESGLPFKVDLVDYHSASKDFQNLIKKDLVLIK